MSADIEGRRFRAWDQNSMAEPARKWVLIAKYNYLRYLKNPIAYLVLIAILLGFFVGSAEMGLFDFNERPPRDIAQYLPLMAVMTALVCGGVVLLGAPSFSEDIRFNALLFYFSRPLRARDYLWGKLAFLISGSLGVGVLAVGGLSMVLLVTGVPYDQSSDYSYFADPDTTVDSALEFLPYMLLAIAGFLSMTWFTIGTVTLASVYTKRAWHAMLGWVAIMFGWTMFAALVFGYEGSGKAEFLFSPGGWMSLVFDHPVNAMYESARTSFQLPLVIAALVLAAGLGTAALALSKRRIAQMEGTL
ncbi:MAG: ABC transporter permease [Thermoplasmatota archaeon]